MALYWHHYSPYPIGSLVIVNENRLKAHLLLIIVLAFASIIEKKKKTGRNE